MTSDETTTRDAPPTAPRGSGPPATSWRRRSASANELQDKLVRAQADFINYQKRSKAQADLRPRLPDQSRWRSTSLDALDNFDRAIESARAGGGPVDRRGAR